MLNKSSNTIAFAACPNFIIDDRRLTPTDRNMILALLRLARNRARVAASNEELTGLVGISERTVQRSLRRLQACGHVDFNTGPGRVVVLLWREPREGHLRQRTITEAPHPGQPRNPSKPTPEPVTRGTLQPVTRDGFPVPPLGTPLEDNFQRDKNQRDGGGNSRTHARATVCPGLPPPHPNVSARFSERIRKPAPSVEEIDRAMDKAAQSLNRDRSTLGDWTRALCERFGFDWFMRALDRTNHRINWGEPLDNPLGYVAGVLHGFKREGGPPPPEEDPEARSARLKRSIEAIFGSTEWAENSDAPAR